MKFVSTRGKSPALSASEAILQGLAPDGGLYVPTEFPQIDLHHLSTTGSYGEFAYEVLAPFFVGDELEGELAEICMEAFNFPLPIHWHNQREGVLELFWGPTAAFKDFGARFLAIAMQRLLKRRDRRLTILVATSGDTGGAVAAAFYNRPGIGVKVLYPYGKVSTRQEKQLTCWGSNIESYAVKGVFDDCQRMVKEAFMESSLVEEWGLSSANSINLGRLLPQIVYGFYGALAVVRERHQEPTIIVPSGNVGNSCGTYWAKEMGAPINKIVLALNANRVVLDYIENGSLEKRPSIATLANAMDVGNPSNMERLMNLYSDWKDFRREVSAYSVSDELILETIKKVWEEKHYIVCPHTATGEYVRGLLKDTNPTLVYATAHPAKFETIVEPIIRRAVEVPGQLSELLSKENQMELIEADYKALF
ncbi:MAG: threonine synthase [Sphaerochaetaceae bacterium]